MRVDARMGRRLAPYLILAALSSLVLLSTGCGSRGAEASIPGGQRTVYLSAIEYKGSTEAAKEPFPTAKLPEGKGYALKAASGDPPKWEVEAYAWAPSTIVVAEGDQVTLQIVGINGAEHASTIEGHDAQFVVKRGEIKAVKFTAGKPGVYKIECHTHAPNMVGQLVVLPKAK